MNWINDSTLCAKLQLASCAFLTGVIWIVQINLYPTFRWVDEARFKDYHLRHTSKISWVVGPAMVIELLTASLLYLTRDDKFLMVVNLLSICFIWILTFFVSVPLHNALSSGMVAAQAERLISTNWLRTAAWSLRLVFLIIILSSADSHAGWRKVDGHPKKTRTADTRLPRRPPAIP